MRRRIYVDESKRGGFRMIAAIVDSPSKVMASRAFRELPKGHSVSNASRPDQQKIVRLLPTLGVQVELFESRSRSELEARTRCLRAVAALAIDQNAIEIVIEQDDSFVNTDREQLQSALAGTDIRFRHGRSRDHPLLRIADAVGWAWQRDHHRRRQIRPMVRKVHVADKTVPS